MPVQVNPNSLALAAALGAHGYRKGSLSFSGAVTAAAVGYLTLGNELRVFGHGLIAFYLIGSRATKYKATRKSQLETGHDPLKPSGNRSALQVLCNSTPPLICSILFRVLFTSERVGWVVSLVEKVVGRDGRGLGGDADVGGKLARALVWASLGHYATCLADTLSSELGILSPSLPVLITTLQPCPPGTNGGISQLGVGASLLGGGVMGGLMGASLATFPVGSDGLRGLLRGAYNFLGGAATTGLNATSGAGAGGILGNGIMAFGTAGSRGDGISTSGTMMFGILKMIVWGAGAGLIGSLLDSLLGATVQQTRYDPITRKILTSHDNTDPATPPKPGSATSSTTEVISGRDILTNNGVNFVSSGVMAVIMGVIGYNL